MNQRDYTEIKKCRICGSTKLFDVIDLHKQPIPNGFLNEYEINKREKKYPLSVVSCSQCTLMQLKYLVKPSIMFGNYLYVPSASKTRLFHFKSLAEEINTTANLKRESLVIDIGSNDGSLLIAFKNLGNRILGIDPAQNLVTIALLNGVETVLGYFDSKLAIKISRDYGKAKAIVATNVIAHIDNIHDVLKGAEILLENNGVFVMQFPYLLDLIGNNLFDTIYHEHLSYFSVKSLMYLSNDSQLEMFDIKKNNLDGGSIKVFWKKKRYDKNIVNKKGIDKILREEEEYGLGNKQTYESFSQRVQDLKKTTLIKLLELKKKIKKL